MTKHSPAALKMVSEISEISEPCTFDEWIQQAASIIDARMAELVARVKYLSGYFESYHAYDHPDCADNNELLTKYSVPE